MCLCLTCITVNYEGFYLKARGEIHGNFHLPRIDMFCLELGLNTCANNQCQLVYKSFSKKLFVFNKYKYFYEVLHELKKQNSVFVYLEVCLYSITLDSTEELISLQYREK